MFLGTYLRKIDDRGRIALPVDFRKGLGAKPIVCQPIGMTCLFIYSREVFDLMMMALKQDQPLSRIMAASARKAAIDKQGRIKLFLEAVRLLGITFGSKVLVLGTSERVEIWQPEAWQEFLREQLAEEKDIPLPAIVH